MEISKIREMAKWREQIKATIEESDLRGICLIGCSEQEAIVDLYRFKGKKEVQKV